MIGSLLPRFNARFRVQPRQPETAYRLLKPTLDLTPSWPSGTPAPSLATTRSNAAGACSSFAVPERTSNALSRAEVVERADGSLSVRHRDAPIASRRASRRCRARSS